MALIPLAEQREEGGCSGKVLMRPMEVFWAGSALLCGHFFSGGKRGLLSSCSAQASHCDGFSYRGARGALTW